MKPWVGAGAFLLLFVPMRSADALIGQPRTWCTSSALVQIAPDVVDVRAYPNPWRSDRDAGSAVTFDHLNGNVTIKIFTIAAEPVKTLVSSDGEPVQWDLTNNHGATVAPGIYLFLAINSEGQKAGGKLAVIR